MNHGLKDDQLPPELLQRRLLLREAQVALLAGMADEAQQRLERSRDAARLGYARLSGREALG